MQTQDHSHRTRMEIEHGTRRRSSGHYRPNGIPEFEKLYVPEPNSGCWLWVGGYFSDNMGYGRFQMQPNIRIAHRAAWTLFRGPIPARLFVLHKCDVPICVNPDHLFLGTHQDNMDDMDRKGRRASHVGVVRVNHRGETHHAAKLTESQVIEMRALYANGHSMPQLEDMFRMSSGAVYAVVKRIKWKHIP